MKNSIEVTDHGMPFRRNFPKNIVFEAIPLGGLKNEARNPVKIRSAISTEAPMRPAMLLPIDLGGERKRDEKSVKFQLFRYCPAQSGFPMRASDNSVGGSADRVAKVQAGNRALIAAQGRLKP